MDKNYDSSMEELTQEEMRMLASMKRQEPQGEEHVAAGIGPKSSCPQSQVTAGTSVTCDPTSAKLTELVSSGSSTSSQYSSEGEDAVGGGHDDHHNIARRRHHRNLKKAPQSYGRQKQGNPNNVSSDSTNSHSAYNTLIIHQNNSSLLADTWIPAAHEFTSYGIGNRRREHDESLSKTQRPAHSYSNPYENIIADESGNHNSNSAFTSSELSEIPRDYLNQLTVLKHLAKEVKQDPISGTSGTSLLRSASFSKSQPDLTQTGGGARVQKMEDPNHLKSQQPPQSGNVRRKKKQSSDNVADTAQESSSYASNQGQGHAMPQQRSQTQQDDVLPSVQILEILMRENAALNAELVNAKRKVSTIHKLESELDRLQASHEALFASAERRESLERTARAKLNTELKRLTAVNRELLSSGSLQNLSPSPYASSTSDIELLKKEIAKRDYTIAQLLAQNKDIATAKERQDIELSAQRATLAEQRTHIEILDRALTNAQANVLRLEEECRKKQEFVDKSSQLQRPLEWKVKDLESRLMEKDAMIRILQTVPASSPSPMYSSASASGIPSYRDSPGYCQASSSPCHPSSASLAAMMSDPPCSMLYSPKGGSEPPSYANLPLKLRLGGSGSSLVKNSNESLQLGGSGPNTGGNSPNISGPGSVCSGSGAKLSIDEQLKELDNQILSKDEGGGGAGSGGASGGGPSGSLKIQSGLCCIPGFPHPGSTQRKGKVPHALLESVTVGSVVLPGTVTGLLPHPQVYTRKTSVLPPKPPTGSGGTGQGQDTGGGQGSRTSSGPPFVSPTDQSPMLRPLVTTTTAMSLSNSVDSVLSDTPIKAGSSTCFKNSNNQSETCNIFAPITNLPKGLPPKPTVGDTQAGKSRSLERSKYVSPGEPCAGKYTSVMYDSSRCRSLDRRELKLSMPPPVAVKNVPEEPKVEDKKESKNLKSSVSSKAAFFGQLLTRRSPSPGRDKEKKEKEGSTPKMGRRFPFGSSKSSQQQQLSSSSSSGEVEERMMLDKQGRQSQRNRISSKWSSCNTLEAVEEQSGSESPWTCRKSKGSPKTSKKIKDKDHVGQSAQGQQRSTDKDVGGNEDTGQTGKKWGRIVKTPFGLRYTFGSPRVAAPVVDKTSSSLAKTQEK